MADRVLQCPKYTLTKTATTISVKQDMTYSDALRVARALQQQKISATDSPTPGVAISDYHHFTLPPPAVLEIAFKLPGGGPTISDYPIKLMGANFPLSHILVLIY